MVYEPYYLLIHVRGDPKGQDQKKGWAVALDVLIF